MGLFDSIANVFGTIYGNAANKQRQDEAFAFNSAEADKNRMFQAQQAEIARDWQESQYNKYSSPQAMVSQYQQAGLNPALMYGQNLQGSTGSSPSPTGSAASGSPIPAQSPTFTGIMEDILALKKIDAEIENIEADSEQKRASAGQAKSAAELNREVKGLTKKQVEEVAGRLDLIREQAATEREKRMTMAVERGIRISEKTQIDLKNAVSSQFEQLTGVKADSQTINAMMLMAGHAISGVASSVGGLLRLFTRGKVPAPQKSLKLYKETH